MNSSFGELGGDTRVSVFASWIDSILDVAGAPRVTDVLLDGSTWTGADPYSFADIVPTGKQLAPIFTQGVNTLQIAFSEHVLLNGSELTLYNGATSTVAPSGFSYDVGSHVGTWTFGTPLDASKYRLELSTAVVDVGGNALDGEWVNLAAQNEQAPATWDNFADDQVGRTYLSGNGAANAPNNKFEFFFSLLAGDSNRDGVVTSADTSSVGDINGDGLANSTDVGLVNGLVGTSLPARNRFGVYTNRGDYLDDEIVDQADYMVWKMTFGSTSDLRADGSGNGIIDTSDYSPWQDNLGDQSAWNRGTAGSGSGSFVAPLVLFGQAPRVANVTVSGSNSVHDPYSFDNVDSSGEQLRTVPVGGADTISVTFSEDVNIQADSLRLTGMYSGNRPELVEFGYDISTMTASWRFTAFTFGDQYLLALTDAVTDVEGNPLDGEWINPAHLTTTNTAVSEFPSGDGNAGGDFNFVLTLLPGDANLDGIVDGQDLSILSANYGTAFDMLFSDADFNGDGAVNFSDLNLMSPNYYTNLQTVKLLADLDGDWNVDMDDLDILFDNWDNGLQNPTQSDGDLDGDGDIDINDLDLAFARFGMQLSVVS